MPSSLSAYGPSRYGFDENANPELKMNRQRQALEQQARIQAARRNPMAQNVPGSGVMSGGAFPNSLDRQPGWKGVIEPRGLDPYAGAQGPTASGAPLGAPAATNAAAIAADPNDWRGKSGIDNAPPPDAGWQMKGTGREGGVIPDTGYNYKGEKSYVDPYAMSQGGSGRVFEVDPSKDQRYSEPDASGHLQTSNANTVQGILDKYQTPGTTASFKPGSVTDVTGASMAQNGAVTPAPQPPHWTGFQTAQDAATARTNSLQAFPEIGEAGSAANKAFVDYAKQNGEPAAHANMESIIGNAQYANAGAAQPKTGAPTPLNNTIAKNQTANAPKQNDTRKEVQPY